MGNPFNIGDFPTEKETILDIAAEDENKRKIHIEVQLLDEEAFIERCLYYSAKVYSQQLEQGEGYGEIKPVVSIILTEFHLFPHLPRLHTSFYMMAREVPGFILDSTASLRIKNRFGSLFGVRENDLRIEKEADVC